MKALILAAGLGTRLRPVTDKIPKALVEAEGKTLIQHAIEHLRNNGINQIIINVHHFSGQIIDFLNKNRNFGVEIVVSDESDQLLDTGGGLKKAGWFFTGHEPFVVRNVDIISNLDLRLMEQFHKQTRAVATLAVRSRKTSRYLIFDEDNFLCGWKNLSTQEFLLPRTTLKQIHDYAFSGIQILSPEILSKITEKGKFTLIDLYLRLCSSEPILGYLEMNSAWRDAGKPEFSTGS